MARNSTLLLITSDAQADRARIARGECPRRDYLEIARLLDADVLDLGSVQRHPAGSRLLRIAGRGAGHALAARSRLDDYDAVFSDNEYAGFFVAMLLRARRRRPRHIVLAHHLSPAKKRPLARLARAAIDALVVHSEMQRRLAVQQLGYAPERVHVEQYQADQRFWHPAPLDEGDSPVICSAGLEFRDYETLVQAVQGLPVEVRIGAASHWSSKGYLLAGRELPARVRVDAYDYAALRELYRRSRFVVVPLFDADFQAGITLILEAMAMGKAVVVTQTGGQAGAVEGPLWSGSTEWPASGPPPEQSTGLYVPPQDPGALRSAITYLLAHPEVAAQLGERGRRVVEGSYTVDRFAQRFAALIQP